MNRRGFTLIEIVIVLMIIGILASFGVPQYLRTIESGKADDAVALVNQIGMTNRMFALDHQGVYVAGLFPNGSNGCGCAAGTCSAYTITPPGPFNNACALVCCTYLSDQDWANKPYNFRACDPVSGGGGGTCAAGRVAVGNRRNSAYAPYSSWGYQMDSSGRITPSGGAPTPTY